MSSSWVSNDYRVYADTDRKDLLPFVPVELERVLDVGCSTGNFGSVLKSRFGCEVWGIESDSEAAELAGEKLDRVINEDFLKERSIPVSYFDCVFFNDVLEHLIDPAAALERSKEFLRPGGFVFASVPNVRYFGNLWSLLIAKDWKYVESGVLDKTHLRFFTKKSIERLFRETGFDISAINGINSFDRSGSRNLIVLQLLNLISAGAMEDTYWL